MSHLTWDPPFLDNYHATKRNPHGGKMWQTYYVTNSIIVSITERGKEALLSWRCVSERQKIGQRKQQSTGNRPLFVGAKFTRLIVELNLYRTKARNNRPWLREWSYTLGFNCRVKCTAISRKKKDRSRDERLSLQHQWLSENCLDIQL